MGWQNTYARNVEDASRLMDQYELRLEYYRKHIRTRDGAIVLLFGEVAERTYDKEGDATLAIICDVTEEEAPLIAEFVASLRAKRR